MGLILQTGTYILWNSVITNLVVNEHVITNRFLGQIGHFSTQMNPVITDVNGRSRAIRYNRVWLYFNQQIVYVILPWDWMLPLPLFVDIFCSKYLFVGKIFILFLLWCFFSLPWLVFDRQFYYLWTIDSEPKMCLMKQTTKLNWTKNLSIFRSIRVNHTSMGFVL